MSNIIQFPGRTPGPDRPDPAVSQALDRRSKRDSSITFKISSEMKRALIDRARESETSPAKVIVDLLYQALQQAPGPTHVRRAQQRRAA